MYNLSTILKNPLKLKGEVAMLVGERMTRPVITISAETPIQEALAQMRREKIRRFPVVDERGKLLGIVAERDLLNASPSEATSLSVFEINYLLSKITVSRVMTKNVITITEDTPIEEAARIMADNKIGCLPVMRNGRLVGIITETNLFKMFLELLGARFPGVRVTALVSDVPGKLFELTGVIRDLGGNIIALGTFLGESSTNRTVTFKVSNVPLETLKEAIAPVVEKIIDIREMKAA
jgi:acetoin utilization protein AcuB